MRLKFWKLSAAGNDFVLIAPPSKRGLPALARRLCDRRRGVGADGLLAAGRAAGAVTLSYFNADGSGAFCGNGARCGAWWAFRQGWSGRRSNLKTSAGLMVAEVTGRERVALSMPEPRGLRLHLSIPVCGRRFLAHAVDTGVPHAVVPVRSLADFPVAKIGSAIRRHRIFGRTGANVDFVFREGAGLRVRTYERGVEDETWACGTGAVAAAVVGWRLGWVRPPVRVRMRTGETMTVTFSTEGCRASRVRLEGPARIAFQGEMSL